jgi:hypothetical protein
MYMIFSFKWLAGPLSKVHITLPPTSCGTANIPDVWNAGRDVELCTWVKIFFRSVEWRLNSLIFVSEQPNITSQKIYAEHKKFSAESVFASLTSFSTTHSYIRH